MSNQSESTRINRDALARELEDMLRPFGLCYRYSGYAGFIDAILMAVENPQRLSCVSKEIYAPVAAKYGLNPINVERNIRTVNGLVWQQNRPFLENWQAGSKDFHEKFYDWQRAQIAREGVVDEKDAHGCVPEGMLKGGTAFGPPRRDFA